jgi:excisionase family DNA binding protein
MSVSSFSDILTIDEISQRLRISVKTLRELARDKEFPVWRVTPRAPISGYWSEVDKWIKKHRVAVK